MKKTFFRSAPLLLAVACHAALAAGERFDIARFQVEGNSLLSEADIGRALGPLTGPDKVYDDIQAALEALALAYRKAGYSAVRVHVPEQQLSGGIVRIAVSESTIGRVTVSGNRYFDEANIRASLGALQPGTSPRLQDLSEAIQLANDNPAKQVEVSLGSGGREDSVDARVSVNDSRPMRVSLTADNTGTEASGTWRTGVALQHANLFNRDHVATVAYATAPDSPAGVHVKLWSLGYRIPLYTLGDSVDVIYGNSSVNTPGTSPALGGLLGIAGKGDVFGMRWNHFFARQGNDTSRLVYSVDHKYINSRCSVNGQEMSFAAPTPSISSCIPYTAMPLGVTYFRRRQSPGMLLDFNLGLVRNVPLGTKYTNIDGRTDRYSYLTPGNRHTRDGFMLVRGGASVFKVYASDWQVRVAASVQLARDALLASEQFGLAGTGGVRGFNERAVTADGGTLVNAEVFTPELASQLGVPGNVRFLAFYDIGRGYNLATGAGATPAHVGIASAGFGLRYGVGRDVAVRADAARISGAAGTGTESRGHWTCHIGMLFRF